METTLQRPDDHKTYSASTGGADPASTAEMVETAVEYQSGRARGV